MNLEFAVERETQKRRVTDAMLNNVLADLPAAEQEELLELSPALFRLELRARASDANSLRPVDRRFLRKFFRPNLDDRAARGKGSPPPNGNRPAPRERPRRREADPNNAN
jgi:hypothetical protein